MIISAAAPRAGQTEAVAGPLPVERWGSDPSRVISLAQMRFNLRRLGWRGFEALPWVRDILARYPAAAELAATCSSHRQADYEKKAHRLFAEVAPQDFDALHSYFVGKLALEDLSCQLNGAAAAACDKRAAYLGIWEISRQYAPQASAPSDSSWCSVR
jgi:hypothetical protein